MSPAPIGTCAFLYKTKDRLKNVCDKKVESIAQKSVSEANMIYEVAKPLVTAAIACVLVICETLIRTVCLWPILKLIVRKTHNNNAESMV
ncbi:hypothetical protein FACS189449_08790 [Alphaproteobacteria bacterium]|nr:hypothetical protein FACS189449_08790 [Alphaproteobacteria bacterium]